MKHAYRRIAAVFIDYTIVFLIFYIFRLCCSFNNVFKISFVIYSVPISIPSFGTIIVLIPIIFKDFLFKNASVGKKIMGLIIVDDNWRTPNFKAMIKRGIIMPTFGYIKLLSVGVKSMDFENWELDTLKTRVIRKSLYINMKERCKIKNGDFKYNMDDLYKTYH